MSDLYAEALSTFAALFEEARQSREVEPNAMTVATADTQGRPSARTVLLKAFDERGFVFYTHLDSHKGRELRANPQAALLFLWRSLREPASRCASRAVSSRSPMLRPTPISPAARA